LLEIKHKKNYTIICLVEGYETINISDLSAATLVIFVLLMSIKPQMVC
jgi:hypothetical protein